MDKIVNFETAKVAAQKLTEEIAREKQKDQSIFDSIMTQVENINPELGGFEELSMLLSLPEDQFMVLAPIFLDELERSMNNVNDKMVLIKALNASGMKMEDLQNEYVTLAQQIDEQMIMISVQKRDFLKQVLAITYNIAADGEGIAKKVIEIPIEFCREGAKMPTYANNGDAGMDIYALEDITILPGQTVIVPTGLKVAIPYGYELQVRPKSGRAAKTKLRIANTPGTIDSGYRDEIGVIIDNIDAPIKNMSYELVRGDSDHETDYYKITSIEFGSAYTIGKGEKFAQLVLNEIPKAAFYEVEHVSDFKGDDRNGGFGSTGLK